MASVHESLYFNPMMTNGVVHANVFGIKDWVTPYKIAVLVLLNEMGRTGEGAVSLLERRRLNQLLLPLLQVRGSSRSLSCRHSLAELPSGQDEGRAAHRIVGSLPCQPSSRWATPATCVLLGALHAFCFLFAFACIFSP